jgi:hypothetical protein
MSHRPLRDGSSRYNSLSARRRQSLGGGLAKESDTTPQTSQRSLLDSYGSRENLHGSSANLAGSAPRRQSLGGDALRGETPIRDRRAMLEAWRQARAENRDHEDVDLKKRCRTDPPLPPSNAFTPNRRKVRRTHDFSQESEGFSQHSSRVDQTLQYYDDETENQSRGSSLLTSRTPISGRGKLGSARRHSLLGRNIGQATGKLAAMVC